MYTVSDSIFPVLGGSKNALFPAIKLDLGFVQNHVIPPQTLSRHNYIIYRIKKVRQLHSQDSQECNWMYNVGEILKIDIVMDVTTQTSERVIKRDPV